MQIFDSQEHNDNRTDEGLEWKKRKQRTENQFRFEWVQSLYL
jgi:hypothetical protein